MRYAVLGVALLVLAGCGDTLPSPVAPTIIQVPIIVGPPAAPAPQPGPHFALELQAASTVPVTAGTAWYGLVTVAANPTILNPEMPATVTATCDGAITTFPGFRSGTVPFSCLWAEGLHSAAARAVMANGVVYQTGMAVRILPAPLPPPPPKTEPEPRPRPIVNVTIYEVRQDVGEARWRFGADAIHAELDEVEWDFGPGANPGSATTDGTNRINVEYNVQGQKEIRWTATLDNDDEMKGSRFITVTFPTK